ncbi:MAG: glycosyltransferase, partial [Dolichospermum sp.]
MKILTISNCPLIESQGSGYVIINFTRGLQERGHEVDLFGPDAYEPLQFLRGRANQYRQALGMLFFCLLQINKKKYDIIEFYGAESWLTVSFLTLFKNRHYLIVSHSNGLETHASVVMSKYHIRTKWYQIDQSRLFE